MPWKESTTMEERQRFINSVLERTDSFKDLCSEYNISTKTGYKWFNRFRADGYAGLQDHSKRPLNHPSRLSEEVVCDLISMKLAHSNFGPKKILELYRRINPNNQPSLSSVNRVLKRAGLVKRRKKRRVSSSGRLVSQVNIKRPNDLWTVDFKGWWMSKDRHRIEPFTVRDAFSRYVLASTHLRNTRTEAVKDMLIYLFKKYGLPNAIQSDNGSPFASKSNINGISQLSAWLISLGIIITHSRPGHPQDNGGHERMHRDLKESVQVRFRGNAKQYQAELNLWREEFNKVRPHEAIKIKTPAEVYQKSSRKYSGQPDEIAYPKEYTIRKVASSGYIKLDGQKFFISTALREYFVGLKIIESYKLAVYFAYVFLGTIDMKTLSFSTEPK